MPRFDAGPWPNDEDSHVIRFAPRREALIVRASDGAPRVFLNECQHIPIPLDSGTRRFLDKKRLHVVCLTHGATYQIDTGLCVAGPCTGDTLVRLPAEVVDGRLVFEVPEALLAPPE